MRNDPNLSRSIVLVTCIFFLWGLSYGLLDVLNKHFQEAMHINKADSGILQVAYFLAYFVIAVPAALFNQRYGYKRGLIAGLVLFATGALLFIPALSISSFVCFVASLFILACGLGFLETTANPYISQLGEQRYAEKRLNLAQAFCGLGTVIGPLIGGALFFGQETATITAASHNLVLQVYVWIAVFVVLLAGVIAKTTMPAISNAGQTPQAYRSLLAHPGYMTGVLAQFLYVAAQVGVGAFFINYATEAGVGLGSQNAAWLLSMAMFLFMAGRFIGTFSLGFLSPTKLLAVSALSCLALSMVVIVGQGYLAIGALTLIFFFMSIMFPTIFSLSINGLGDKTKIGSSLLAMAVSGGALYPYAMGYIADHYGTSAAYTLPLISFAFILGFAMTQEKLGMPNPAVSQG
ncbi:sugar MFS transporter [Chromobacterium amazonense]|uniref:sugar MFS transporter n=1 Tax=Chromobacterium amazonense TaxID=1382803 RepID=UPI001CB9CA9B|nr:sugar MFS transporter [Chromobacterium amazonense]